LRRRESKVRRAKRAAAGIADHAIVMTGAPRLRVTNA
jgi:hypothetical protein